MLIKGKFKNTLNPTQCGMCCLILSEMQSDRDRSGHGGIVKCCLCSGEIDSDGFNKDRNLYYDRYKKQRQIAYRRRKAQRLLETMARRCG
jgi:hypothetical protein